MVDVQPSRLLPRWWFVAALVLVATVLGGLSIGPVPLTVSDIWAVLIGHLPGVTRSETVSLAHEAIIWDIRFPRVMLGVLVGGTLAMSGAAYQGVFRNPLADPYLLGVAAGAGSRRDTGDRGWRRRFGISASGGLCGSDSGCCDHLRDRSSEFPNEFRCLADPVRCGCRRLPHGRPNVRAAAQLRNAARGLLVDPWAAVDGGMVRCPIGSPLRRRSVCDALRPSQNARRAGSR